MNFLYVLRRVSFWVVRLIALLFLSALGFCVLQVGFRDVQIATTQAACHYEPQAVFQIAGHQLHVPALRGTEVWFPQGSPVEYLGPDDLYPYQDEVLGFCPTTLATLPAPERVSLKGKAIEGMAAGLGLHSAETITEIGFGTEGLGAWMTPPPADPEAKAPGKMVRFGRTDPRLPWDFMATAGWLPEGTRVSTFCAPWINTPMFICNLRVTRRADSMVFEVWGLKVSEAPKAGEVLPPQLLGVAARLPLVLEQFEMTGQP